MRSKYHAGMPLVFVYFNLHKKVWSVKSVETGRVIAHLHSLVLYLAKPKVSEAGRQRVLRERKKNVHAGFEGYIDLSDPEFLSNQIEGRAVTYNPYKYSGFVWRDNEQLLDNEEKYLVLFSNRNVIATPPIAI